jgi:GNAT superfamily N-acetyltransferase
MIEIVDDPYPGEADMQALWSAAWGSDTMPNWASILPRSLAHVGAREDGRLIGFVNVAWDGGVHAFLLDICVHPDYRRRGLGQQLVRRAAALARDRGAQWLHVDFEPHLDTFYRDCGFRPTAAGLIRLAP